VLVSLAFFVGFGALLGIVALKDGVAYFVLPLSAVVAWAVVCGPLFLSLAITASRRKRRVLRVVRALPAHHGKDRAMPGYAGELAGIVSYRDGRLRLTTPQGPAIEIPFPDIYLVEELPPKGFSHFSGIDVLTKTGQWTEFRGTDNKEVLSVLEQAGVPVVRAVNRLWVNALR
jgi:hypothetical protein